MTRRGAATLILGMGNPILSDDSIGVRLARDLRRHLGGRFDVDVVEECSVGGLNLLDYLAGYERVILLDAIHTRGGRAGDVYGFRATGLRPTAHLCNVHDANFATALELGRRLGAPLPDDEEIHVFAVEVLDDRTFGTELTPALARAYPECLRTILAGTLSILAGAPADAEGNDGTDDHSEGPAVGAHPAPGAR
jgi:hydrogenase maturation protease